MTDQQTMKNEKPKKNKKRSAEIFGVFAKHNFYTNGFTPEELRTTLEDLGPTYVKIGQIMSSRTDMLPKSYCRELEKLGCKLTEREDGMSITGGVTSGIVDSHGDHRLAMAFSLIGLKHDIEITNGEVFDVSFPNFIEAMAELGFELELKNE